MMSVRVAAVIALLAILYFSSVLQSCVSVVKKVMLPIGLTMAMIAMNTESMKPISILKLY